MSLYRDQNVTSNTTVLPDVPFKKRKDSRLLDDDDDDDDALYINPYLNSVRNVTPQKGEASHSCISSLAPKGSSHLSAFDDFTGQNLTVQNGLSSSHKYFNLHSGLCGITSDYDKYPYVFNLTRNESSKECSEISGDEAKNLRLSYGEGANSLVSLLMSEGGSQPSSSISNKDSAAHGDFSSASPKCFPLLKLNGDLTRKKIEQENSGISDDRTSTIWIKPDQKPSLPSKSHEDSFPLNYDLCSKNVFSSLPRDGTCGNVHPPASVSYNNTLDTPFRTELASSLKLCENMLSPSSKFGIKPKLAKNQTSDLPSSLTLHKSCPSSKFITYSMPSKNQSDALSLSLKTHRNEPFQLSEYVFHTSSSSTPELHEGEHYFGYKCADDSRAAEQKSCTSSTVKFPENGISPVFQWKHHRDNETIHFTVPKHSDSSESFRDGEIFGCVDSSLKNEVKYIESDSLNMLLFKNKLCEFKHELPCKTERTLCSEIGTTREVDTISKQGLPGNYEGPQVSHQKKDGENISVVRRECQGRKTGTKEEHSAVGNTELPCREDGCIPGGSGTIPMKNKKVLNAADHHCLVTQEVNTDGRKNFEEDTAVCIDNIQTLNCEHMKRRNSDHEEAILLSDDSDDNTITIYDFNDDFEETDDIEIVKCVRKSNVGKTDFSVQQKALDFRKSQARHKNHEHKDKKMLSHPFEVSNVLNFSKSLGKPNGSSCSHDASNFMDVQRGDEQLLGWILPEAHGASRTSSENASHFQAAKSLCLDMCHPAPAHKPQTLQCHVCDLSRSSVIQSTATPSSLSPAHNIFKAPRKKIFPCGISNFPYSGRPLDFVSSQEYPSSLHLPFPLGSESSSSHCNKKHGCDTNLVSTSNECMSFVWNQSVPTSGNGNFVASRPESILHTVPNSLAVSFEPGNKEQHSVPPTDMSQPMPTLDTPLKTPGALCNLQEGKEVTKKRPNAVEDKTEKAQRNSRPEWECAVCLEILSSKRGISTTLCGHVYCTPCITEVVCKKKECPTCRRTLDSTQVLPLFISG